MMTGLLLDHTLHSEPVTIRALSSITTHQTEIVLQALDAGGRSWDVRVDADYDGYRMILIEPGIGNAEQASYFVSGTELRLDLSQARGDEFRTLGTFDDVAGLLARLLEAIGRRGGPR